ncbi:Fc.00g038290.m01.CDS01 [Cosmosporella sp. VM-42]
MDFDVQSQISRGRAAGHDKVREPAERRPKKSRCLPVSWRDPDGGGHARAEIAEEEARHEPARSQPGASQKRASTSIHHEADGLDSFSSLQTEPDQASSLYMEA